MVVRRLAGFRWSAGRLELSSSGQSWLLLEVLLLVAEVAAWSTSCVSFNKVRGRFVLLHLAGHGGEGVRRTGVGRAEDEFLLAGSGGEGVKLSAAAFSASRRWWFGLRECSRWVARGGVASGGFIKPGEVQVWQNSKLFFPLRGSCGEEDRHPRARLLPHSAAPRESRPCVYLISLDAAIQSGCYTADQLRIAFQVVYAIFKPLGCIRRRHMRSSPKSLPRFSGEDFPALSSVMHPRNLQLNPLPRMPLSTRLLVEPLALRLVRLFEAPEENSCRIVASVFSTDPLAGTDCVLLLRLLVLPVVLLDCVHPGSRCRRGGERSDCFSTNVSKVLFVKCEGYVRIVLSFTTLFVFVTPPILNE